MYGVESFQKISSEVSGAHRYITKTLFPNYKSHMDINNRQISNKNLYGIAADGAKSVFEIHRILRNNFIYNSKSSSNMYIRQIIGELDLITYCHDIPDWFSNIVL